MKALPQIPRSSDARGIAVVCSAVFVITAHTAQAGINVWTSHGPPGGYVTALAIDPRTPAAAAEEGTAEMLYGVYTEECRNLLGNNRVQEGNSAR